MKSLTIFFDYGSGYKLEYALSQKTLEYILDGWKGYGKTCTKNSLGLSQLNLLLKSYSVNFVKL